MKVRKRPDEEPRAGLARLICVLLHVGASGEIIAAMLPEDTAPTNERAAYLRGALAAWHIVVPGA